MDMYKKSLKINNATQIFLSIEYLICVISLSPETIAAKQSMDFVRSYFGTNEMKLTSDQLNTFFLTFFQISTDLEKKVSCITDLLELVFYKLPLL